MRKFLILTLFFFYNSKAIADLYQCNFKIGDLTIYIDTSSERRLKSGNNIDGTFESDDKVFSFPIHVGEVTFIPKSGYVIRKGKYDAAITSYSKLGDGNFFRAIFFETTSLHTLVINMWDKNLPGYLYSSDRPDKVAKGKCK